MKLTLFILICLSTTVSVLAKNDKDTPVQSNNQYRVQTQSVEISGGTPSITVSVTPVQTRGNTNRSDSAREHFSQVAETVEQILQSGYTGGIGPQVREIARAQNQVQTQLQEKFQKVSQNGLLKKLFGYNRQLNKEMTELLEQNQLKIQELQQLLTKTQNASEQTTLRNLIQTLESQQTNLQNVLQNEANQTGFFGRIFNLFRR